MKDDVVPVHATEGHELGNGLLEKGKGRGPHGMRVILRDWHLCGLLVEKGGNLLCSDGCKLVAGES
jgi:hypothetical protein